MSTFDILMAAASQDSIGQVAYTTPGTFTWTCPLNVHSVCVVCVGPGGIGDGTIDYRSGGGGGLGYKNNIAVVPGTGYALRVGTTGQDSYFIDTATVKGGAPSGTGGQTGGTYTGDGGGNGGNGGTTITGTVTHLPGPGGAGGYAGNGGNGGNGYSDAPGNTTATAGTNGSGGAGGGSGGGVIGSDNEPGGGGGVGILGQGASGNGTPINTTLGVPGYGGSGGANGTKSPRQGGQYGGGSYLFAGTGSTGAVRIIWGANRAFPSTNTGDL